MSVPDIQAHSQPGGWAARVLSRSERISLYVAALTLGVIFVMVTTAIVTRMVGLPLMFADEYSEYLMAASVFLALPAITASRKHLAAEFLVAMCRPSGQARLRLLADVALLLFSLALVVSAARMTWVSYEQGLRSQGLMVTPLFVPQLAMLAGLLVLVLSAGLQVAVSARQLTGAGSSTEALR